MLMANAKNKGKKGRIVGIVILVIGSFFLVFANIYANMVASSLTGWGEAIGLAGTIQGVVIIVIGLVVLLASRKKNSKSPDKSITK